MTPPPRSGNDGSILRFMLCHLLYGTVGAVVFTAALLYLDIGGIRTMIGRSGGGAVPVFLLFFGLFVTFGGISIGMGVMGLGTFRDGESYRDERDRDP